MNYQMLLKGVELFKQFPQFDKDYKECVLDCRQVWENVDQITESEIKETVIEFLRRWKIRNVNRINPCELKDVLKQLDKYFKALRNKSLIDVNFDEEINVGENKRRISEIIQEVCKQLNQVNGIGPTAASKIMHCILPQFFMMWDEKIRSGYGYAGNATGYLKFMRESQQIIRSIIKSSSKSPKELCREASPTISKTLTKLLDEFNYMRFTKEADLPNPTEDC